MICFPLVRLVVATGLAPVSPLLAKVVFLPKLCNHVWNSVAWFAPFSHTIPLRGKNRKVWEVGHYQYSIGQPDLQYPFSSVYKKFTIRKNVRVCEIFNNVRILHRVMTIHRVVGKAIVCEKVGNVTVNCVVKFVGVFCGKIELLSIV